MFIHVHNVQHLSNVDRLLITYLYYLHSNFIVHEHSYDIIVRATLLSGNVASLEIIVN